jgi:hypothetical protein
MTGCEELTPGATLSLERPRSSLPWCLTACSDQFERLGDAPGDGHGPRYRRQLVETDFP